MAEIVGTLVAGGDLSGTYPNPSVVDDSHSHTTATAPGGSVRWEPLTNGLLGGMPGPIADPLTVTPEVLAIAFNQLLAATQLVFVDGDVIMVEVP